MNTKEGEKTMTPKEMKDLRIRFNKEVDSNHDVDAVDELVADDFRDHVSVPGLPDGKEGLKQRHAAIFSAFPDFKIIIEDMVAEDDKVVSRLKVTGTHRGELFGIEVTGKSISYKGFDMMRIANGRIVEQWATFDHLSLMQQLGAIPDPGIED